MSDSDSKWFIEDVLHAKLKVQAHLPIKGASFIKYVQRVAAPCREDINVLSF